METAAATSHAPPPALARSALPAVLLLAAAALAGCGAVRLPSMSARPAAPAMQAPAQAAVPSAPRGAPGDTVPRLLAEGWRCEDGRSVGTRVLPGSSSMELRIEGTRRVLPQVASASGARFEDADWLFWNRGGQALLQRKPAPPAYCNEVRALSLIEDARARGVTFRGQGRNPGWLLEIGPDDRVVLVPAGAADAALPGRTEWPALAATPGPTYGSTRHVGVADGRRHVIVVQPDAPCVDELTGERAAATVLLEVDGRRLRGCGTPIAP
jgi:membrane-bound inhibitor of C-type lysozyme